MAKKPHELASGDRIKVVYGPRASEIGTVRQVLGENEVLVTLDTSEAWVCRIYRLPLAVPVLTFKFRSRALSIF